MTILIWAGIIYLGAIALATWLFFNQPEDEE